MALFIQPSAMREGEENERMAWPDNYLLIIFYFRCIILVPVSLVLKNLKKAKQIKTNKQKALDI
jgi:hypothetical protein